MIRLTDLPDDILEDIFHGMRDIMRFPGEPPYAPLQQGQGNWDFPANFEHKAVPLWANVIALSHVCRHWRNLMLTRPHLWSFIRVTGSFSNRIMVNEMIERSVDTPLSILLTNSEQAHDPNNLYAVYDLIGVTSVIGDHSKRIQELGVVLRGEHAALVLDSLSKCSLPRLEKLWLESAQYSPEHVSTFDIMIPSLRVIHVHQIAICWLPLQNLTQLELTCGTSPPLPALLDTLQHSPFLQYLTLRIALISEEVEDDAVPEDEPTAILPCLRRLQLHVDPTFNGAFSVLPHLVFPSSTAVRLSFTGRFASSLYEDCESLEALACSLEHATFTLDDNHAYIVSRTPQLGIYYEVADYESDEPGPDQGIPTGRLCEGFLAIPLPALTSLSIRIYSDPDSGLVLDHERFYRLFQAVRSIQRLAVDVHPEDSVHVFTALATVAKDEEEDGGMAFSVRSCGSSSWHGRTSRPRTISGTSSDAVIPVRPRVEDWPGWKPSPSRR
ncbi:hypothetical protein C8T65DRAFT_734421 [Cerioporus squamosus]|nr:hypothetical protein C8T65DRAFT_734421 [Cerioporus squamosus]